MRTRVVLVPDKGFLDDPLKVTLDAFFKDPNYYYLPPVHRNNYYKIVNKAVSMVQQHEYHQYYLLCLGSPILIAVLSAKLMEAIGRFKAIEVGDTSTDVRSLDIP